MANPAKPTHESTATPVEPQQFHSTLFDRCFEFLDPPNRSCVFPFTTNIVLCRKKTKTKKYPTFSSDFAFPDANELDVRQSFC